MSKIFKLLLTVCTWVVLAGNAFAVAPENGWWWNSNESGSGYAIERQGNSIFMAAFLYETTGAATWYATLLTLQPDGTYKGDMTRYVGGKSLLGTYKPATPTSIVATATASFPKPDSGTMTITFPNGSPNRTIAISRFAFATPSFEPSKGSFQSGWWWNDQESGTGYFVEVQGTSAFIASFMYDTSGQPTWYASLSSLSGNNLLSGPVDMYTNGQALGGSYQAPTANAGAAGAMSYGFTSDSLGNMTLPNLAKVAIKRFVFDASAVSNHPPVPNAGANQTVTVGDTVNLTGTATDADGDNLTFSWRLLSVPTGSAATVNAWNTSKANFVADVAGTYRLELIADDGKVSNGGSVITVIANTKAITNIAPVANAGPNQYVSVGINVNLSGAASSDANGDFLTYQWSIISKPTGSAATLASSTTVSPSFTADVVGSYVVGLTVNDGKVSSLQSSVTITATLTPIRVLSSSYENQIKAGNDLGPQDIPFEWKPCADRAPCGALPTPAAAFSDYLRNGTYQLIQHSIEYNAVNSLDKDRKGKIKFYELINEEWIESTEKIFPNGGNEGCLQAGRAIVADFLNNGRPSVFFPCFGFDGEGGVGEKQRILLANSDGTFTNKLLDNIPILPAGYASAADINGDGYPDIAITGSYLSNSMIFLINDKNGGFILDISRFPKSLDKLPYFSAELVRNKNTNKYDLLLGGVENCCLPMFSPGRLFYNDGNGYFSDNNYIQIPSYKNYGMIIDFLYEDDNIYMGKVPDTKAEYYQSYILQKYNIITKESKIIYENITGWLNPLGQNGTDKIKFIYNIIFHNNKIKSQNSFFNLSVDAN